MSELAQLKSQLRSLVVSSPTAVDARALLRDYRTLVGEPLPAARHGYRDPVHFLRERCSDCFVFQGPTTNPVLTLIVPDQLKHIDEFVQRQKMPSTKNFRVKRRSIPETHIQPQNNLISRTFVPPVRKYTIKEETNKNRVTQTKAEPKIPEIVPTKKEVAVESVVQFSGGRTVPTNGLQDKENIENSYGEAKEDIAENKSPDGIGCAKHQQEGSMYTKRLLQRFLQKRSPLYQSQPLERAPSADSLRDDDSGRQTTSSSSSGSKQAALERLKDEVVQLVTERPDGVWASQLMRLYEERFGRELNYARFGFPSIAACACACAPGRLAAAREPAGDWLLRAGAAPAAPAPRGPPAPPGPRVRRPPSARAPSAVAAGPVDPDDALPGIEYDADVFPEDCLSFVESIPAASVAGVAPGDMLALVVGEVYSPSHLWVLRLGPEYDQMEDIMDEMTEYFTKGEGVSRVLAAGARRPGQYCSSVYDGDWHRSLIVQLVDADTVKVRHVDYGTVDTVAATALRPLRRAWAALPAQAVRARLAGLRPPAAGRRWPRAAAAHCLRLVRDKRLVGNVLAVDHEEGIVELFLIDTATEDDVNITDELVRAGHADARAAPALGASEAYLFPLFGALEAGATPNYAEIHALLRDGIVLDYVEAYRRHVPALLPAEAAWRPAPGRAPSAPSAPPAPAAPPAAPAAPPRVDNRVPLAWARDPAAPSVANQTLPPTTVAAQTFSPTTVAGETFSPTRVAGDIFSPTTVAGETFSPTTIAGETFSPTTVAGETFSPTTVASQTLSPTTVAAQSFSSISVASQTLSPTTVAAHTFSPNTVDGQTPTPTAVAPSPAPGAPPAHGPPLLAGPPLAPRPPLLAGPPPCGPGRHPAAFYAVPHGYFPCFPVAPQFPPAPPPPRAARLSAEECEVFELLSLVDKNAAHRYVAAALRRARGPAPLNPLAPEFRTPHPPHPPPPPPPQRPPPGFELPGPAPAPAPYFAPQPRLPPQSYAPHPPQRR